MWLSEDDHAADAVLRLHQLEAAVDLVQRERVRDERIHVELAVEPSLDKAWHAVAALHAAEGRAGDPAAGDEVARDDVERLALARDAAHRGEAPAHPSRLDRLSHDRHLAGGLERVVGAEAVRQLEDA